ncbi:heparinase II/III domain-containing protein [Consotaella aegiceratis]|uniref:heparinase II/III domain-containing protein n=1 Tax=Consotaella aegiceratis TaxID=3097961 RepID=UPI002F4074FE
MFVELLDRLPAQLAEFAPRAPARDRAAWTALPSTIAASLVARGESLLGQPYPSIPATDYMAFCRTGNRVGCEELYMARRRMLNALVMAECVEAEGRFIDAVIDGIFALCEESGWQLPAHNSYVRDTPQIILPDTAAPVIDLFAAETGAQLAMVRHLLGAELDAISPLIGERIRREIQTRIVTPYLDRHFWWMGNGDEPMCNWTVWCTQNVLLAAFTTGQSQETKRRVVEKAAHGMDAFLKDYGEDGCCEEGVLYYRHAGLCLFNAMEVLNAVTDGTFAPLFGEPKIRNIAEYILHMHVADRHYFNFADCSAVVERAGVREFLFGQRVDSAALASFAAADWQRDENHDLPDELNLFYRLQAAFTAREIVAYPAGQEDKREIYYPSNGVFVARDAVFDLAVKAGDNGDSHNHNDTGSLTLYKNGKPLLIDVGVESYTAKTFSPRRYEIWTMQSAYHNLPTFGGVMQEAGAAFAARDVEVSFGPGDSRIAMEIAGAYPPEADVACYRREVRLVKGEAVVVEDRYEGERPAELSLMFVEHPEISDGLIRVGDLGTIHLDGAGTMRLEEIPITDVRLRWAWPDRLYRVLVPMGSHLMLTVI